MAKRPSARLTALEGDIMRAVWDAPGPVTVRDVAAAVNARRKPPLAYTTIQTMLTILRDKGAVDAVEGPGRAHLYRARISREQASRHQIRELVDRFFDGRLSPLLHQLIGEENLDPAELKELRAWVDAKLRDTGRDTKRGGRS